MIISKAQLMRMMRAAYKGAGLHVAVSDEGDLVMSGQRWSYCILEDYIPNEVKGLIVSLGGLYPQKNEQYQITKDGAQMEVYMSAFGMVPYRESMEAAGREDGLKDTMLTARGIFGVYRIYRREKGNPVVLREDYAGLISQSYCEAEETLDGPYFLNGRLHFISIEMSASFCGESEEEIRNREEDTWKRICYVAEGAP